MLRNQAIIFQMKIYYLILWDNAFQSNLRKQIRLFLHTDVLLQFQNLPIDSKWFCVAHFVTGNSQKKTCHTQRTCVWHLKFPTKIKFDTDKEISYKEF